jgi:metal-sulfur cluster biosynthetic enzyme
MGLGDMFTRLFKKEEERDTKTNQIENEGRHEEEVGTLKRAESSRTENIHGLETRNLEEDTRSVQSEERGVVSQGEGSGISQDVEKEGASSVREPVITEERVLEVLSDVYDPEIPIDIVNLGLVYGVSIEGRRVNVKMTLTSPGCPTAGEMVQEAQILLEELPGVEEATIEVVWDPPWDPSRMSEEAKRALGYI